MHFAWQSHCKHQIVRFAKMSLRDRCSTSYYPATLFRSRRRQMEWNNREFVRGRPLCTQLFIFEGRLTRRIASFLMLSTSKIEEVSQNCLVFDDVKLKIEEVSRNCSVFDVVQFKN